MYVSVFHNFYSKPFTILYMFSELWTETLLNLHVKSDLNENLSGLTFFFAEF